MSPAPKHQDNLLKTERQQTDSTLHSNNLTELEGSWEQRREKCYRTDEGADCKNRKGSPQKPRSRKTTIFGSLLSRRPRRSTFVRRRSWLKKRSAVLGDLSPVAAKGNTVFGALRGLPKTKNERFGQKTDFGLLELRPFFFDARSIRP